MSRSFDPPCRWAATVGRARQGLGPLGGGALVTMRSWLATFVIALSAVHLCFAAPNTQRLSRAELLDKIRGAWAGQMIGVAYGARTEFHFKGRTVDGEIQPEPLSNALNQDDLYVEMTWRQAWQQITAKWDRNDPCPKGALEAYNIDAKLNGAYVALGLLYGAGDLDRTMGIATRCGQDSDCNPSSAAGVVGTLLGWSRLPDRYRAEIEKIAHAKFAFTDYSFADIVRSTEARALQLIRQTGGRVTADEVVIRVQPPKAANLERPGLGIPDRRIPVADPAWTFRGAWADENGARSAHTEGAEATLRFDGTGIALIGRLSPDGGRADVFLDGRRQPWPADAYVPERTHDIVLWHRTGLKPGAHTLRLVTRADADPRSRGQRVTLSRIYAVAKAVTVWK